jgi:hypothetical protein
MHQVRRRSDVPVDECLRAEAEFRQDFFDRQHDIDGAVPENRARAELMHTDFPRRHSANLPHSVRLANTPKVLPANGKPSTPIIAVLRPARITGCPDLDRIARRISAGGGVAGGLPMRHLLLH